jgi:arginase family enzyme
VYVALDLDVLDPKDVDVLVPEPDGPTVDRIAATLEETVARTPLAGIGVTGHLRTDKNAAVAARLLASAGL